MAGIFREKKISHHIIKANAKPSRAGRHHFVPLLATTLIATAALPAYAWNSGYCDGTQLASGAYNAATAYADAAALCAATAGTTCCQVMAPFTTYGYNVPGSIAAFSGSHIYYDYGGSIDINSCDYPGGCGAAPPPASSTNGACVSYGSTYTAQPAYDNATGCSAGTYVNLGDTATDFVWQCTGSGGGSTATCTAAINTSGPPPPNSVCNPSGQTSCPTNNCFFWVSGVLPGSIYEDNWIGKIGDTETHSVGIPTSYMVGPGNYADSYANGTGPFAGAGDTTFDGIAIGADTHVRIYSGTNYTGTVLLDVSGPYVLSNYKLYEPFYGASYNYNDYISGNWSSLGPILSQFPPATRHLLDPPEMHSWSYGSVQVSCTSPPSGACVTIPGCPPSSTNGACDNSVALGCSTGTAASDNGQTSCGTTRTWICQGSGGGSDSGTCSFTNSACPPTLVNGACNNATPLGCTDGTAISDNGQTSCGTTRSWVCQGANGGTDSAACSYTNAACPPAPCTTYVHDEGPVCADVGPNLGNVPQCVLDVRPGLNDELCSFQGITTTGNQVGTAHPEGFKCATLKSNPSGKDAGHVFRVDCSGSPPVLVDGVCSGSVGECTSGTPMNDDNVTACGTTRNWLCEGSGGGTSVPCSILNPACPTTGCGTAAGISTVSAPSSNLCATGTASSVTQNGSLWEWTCTP